MDALRDLDIAYGSALYTRSAGQILPSWQSYLWRFCVFGNGNGPEIPRIKRRVDVYEAVNNLDKIPQPNSTAPIFCSQNGACEDSQMVWPQCQAASCQRRDASNGVAAEKRPQCSPSPKNLAATSSCPGPGHTRTVGSVAHSEGRIGKPTQLPVGMPTET